MAVRPDRGLEVWAGVECTVNRVGEAFLDQIERTRHAELDRAAAEAHCLPDVIGVDYDLTSERDWILPPLGNALARYRHARPVARGPAEQLLPVADTGGVRR